MRHSQPRSYMSPPPHSRGLTGTEEGWDQTTEPHTMPQVKGQGKEKEPQKFLGGGIAEEGSVEILCGWDRVKASVASGQGV